MAVRVAHAVDRRKNGGFLDGSSLAVSGTGHRVHPLPGSSALARAAMVRTRCWPSSARPGAAGTRSAPGGDG